MIMSALGVPVSGSKLRVSTHVAYLGFAIDLTTSSFALPQAKLDKAIALLRQIRKGETLAVKVFDKLTGLLLCVTWIAIHMRPWLAAFFNKRHKPAVAVKCADASQLHELASVVSEYVTPRGELQCIHAKAAWKIAKVGKCTVAGTESLLKPAWKNDIVRITFTNKDPSKVRVSAEAALAARLWSATLSWMPQFYTCSNSQGIPGVAAADACATKDCASIGGW